MTLDVYSTDNCQRCRATVRMAREHGHAVNEHKLADHPDIEKEARERGWNTAPIVHADNGDKWCGHRPDKLKNR